MLSTKDPNSFNENPGIKASLVSSKTSNIFDDANNYSGCSLSSVNSFRSSDRSSYTATGIDTFQGRNYTDNYVLKSSKSNDNATQAMPPATSRTIAALAIQPDLIVRNTSNPSSASVGSTIQLTYEIENQGNASAGYSYTKFYLSRDLSLGSEDIFLGYDDVSNIPSGYYSPESTTLTIGNSVAVGTYYLVYQADGYENVAETNESNNAVAGTINITKADLIIQNAIAPTSASVGSTIQLDYQVKNQGVGSAVASQTNFYLSKDKILSSDDTDFGYNPISSIAAGSYLSKSTTITIGNSIATGNYYLLYRADSDGDVAESNENNNIIARAIAITKADLIIQNAVAPTSASVGKTINISYQVKNQGVGSAVATNTKFYLSKDNAYSTDDVLLGSDAVNAIAAGASRTQTSSIVIGNTISGGNYYLLYKADADSKIGESNETNNIVSKAITINGPKPDLIIQNVSVPSLVDPGSLITVNYQLANQGTATAGTSTTKFYLSKDTALSNDDTLLDSDQNYFYSGLGADYYSSESEFLVLSSSTTFGNYYLLLQADGNGEIFESNENNNVTAKAITIAAPDLVIQNAIAPASANIGTSIKVSYQVKNQGNGKTSRLNSTYFYLSKDTSFSNDDVYLGYDYINNYNDLAPSAVSSESTSLSLPSKTTPGNYYLLYKADGDASLKESNENNNVVAKAIKITAPDLVIQNTTAPASAAIGTTITLSYKLKNQGNGNAAASNTYFYLSRDTTLGNDDDISIGYASENSVAVAVSGVISQSTTWTIDTTIAAGKYYLMFKADSGGNVAESNESNNAVYIPFTLTPANGGGFNSTTGYGLINAAAAVAKALGQTTFADVPDLGGDNWGADAIKAPEVWAKGYTGQGVIVAVIDSGVDYNHPDLKANIWKNTKEIAGNGKDDDGNGYIDDVNGWNFVSNNNNPLDDNSHGTHVAGTIAAVKNNFGVTGIAYNAKIMPVKVLDSDGQGYGSAIAKGIRYAVDNGAKVINLSLGGSASSDEQSAIQYAASKGAIVVMAAGNESESAPGYPARYADKLGLAVGAVSYNRTLAADFSNLAGTTPLAYVTAPGAYLTLEDDGYLGIGIYSTVLGNDYGVKDGTSMAAPHVAGVVALMLSAKKGLTDAQVRKIVTTTAGNSLA